MRRREFLGWLAGSVTGLISAGCAKDQPKPKPRWEDHVRQPPRKGLLVRVPQPSREYYRQRVWDRIRVLNFRKKYNRYRVTEPLWDRVQFNTMTFYVIDYREDVLCPTSFDFTELQKQHEHINAIVDNRFEDSVRSIQDCIVDRAS